MSDFTQRLDRLEKSPPQVVAGVMSSLSPLRVIVGGQESDCLVVAPYRPAVGDQVAVAASQGVLRVLGWVSARALPSTATVTATSVAGRPGFVAVTDSRGVAWQVTTFQTVTMDSVVGLEWGGSTGRVIGVIQAAPSAPPPAEQIPGGQLSGEEYFPAVSSGSFRDGRWRTDTDNVAQWFWPGYGEDRGAWFYGGALRQQIGGATVTYAALYMARQRSGANAAQPVHLYRHSSDVMPAGDVTRTAGPFDVSMAIGQAGYQPVPLGLVQALVDGGGGIGVMGSPYVVLTGRSGDQQSGTLFVKWSR